MSEALHRQRRYLIASRKLNLSDLERTVSLTMLLFDQRWPVQTLADEIGYSRASVRTVLKTMKAFDAAEECAQGGWALTDSGREIIRWLFDELSLISRGERREFSTALLDALEALQTPKNVAEATKVLELPRHKIF